MNKHERTMLKEASVIAMNHDCRVRLERTGKNHPRFVFEHRPSGRTRYYVTASTTNSNRGMLNAKCAFKRICRQLGVEL